MTLRIGRVFGAGCNRGALGFSFTEGEEAAEEGMAGHR